jgi:diguanylate cyclase (GGDEF)-like protein
MLLMLAVVVYWRYHTGRLLARQRQLEAAVRLRTQDLENEKSKLTLAHEQMRHHAEHDGMTGIWNHRMIVESLRRELARSHRNGTSLSVMIIDLDYFKRVNDTFGHQTGDLVLQQVAERLRLTVRPYDLVERYGGEEFLVVLPGMGLSEAQLRAEEKRGPSRLCASEQTPPSSAFREHRCLLRKISQRRDFWCWEG